MNPAQLAMDAAWTASGHTKHQLTDLAARFQEGTPHVSAHAVITFCLITAALALLLLYLAHVTTMRDGRSYYSTSHLFRELCQLHQLDWPSRHLLKRLAQAHQLSPPSRLFLEPLWFERSRLPAALRPAEKRIGEIKHQLFEVDEPAVPNHAAAVEKAGRPRSTCKSVSV